MTSKKFATNEQILNEPVDTLEFTQMYYPKTSRKNSSGGGRQKRKISIDTHIQDPNINTATSKFQRTLSMCHDEKVIVRNKNVDGSVTEKITTNTKTMTITVYQEFQETMCKITDSMKDKEKSRIYGLVKNDIDWKKFVSTQNNKKQFHFTYTDSPLDPSKVLTHIQSLLEEVFTHGKPNPGMTLGELKSYLDRVSTNLQKSLLKPLLDPVISSLLSIVNFAFVKDDSVEVSGTKSSPPKTPHVWVPYVHLSATGKLVYSNKKFSTISSSSNTFDQSDLSDTVPDVRKLLFNYYYACPHLPAAQFAKNSNRFCDFVTNLVFKQNFCVLSSVVFGYAVTDLALINPEGFSEQTFSNLQILDVDIGTSAEHSFQALVNGKMPNWKKNTHWIKIVASYGASRNTIQFELPIEVAVKIWPDDDKISRIVSEQVVTIHTRSQMEPEMNPDHNFQFYDKSFPKCLVTQYPELKQVLHKQKAVDEANSKKVKMANKVLREELQKYILNPTKNTNGWFHDFCNEKLSKIDFD